MKRRLFYGWLDMDTRKIRVSLYPPDAPVRPSVELASIADAKALTERKRADIHWWPPLPKDAP